VIGRDPWLFVQMGQLANFDRFEVNRVLRDGSNEIIAAVTAGTTPSAEPSGTATIKCTNGPCKILKEWIDKDGNLQSKESTIPEGAVVVIPAGSGIMVTCLSGCSSV
jgi:hypothetical protein